ncbi:MAG: T9SS type A sorting domain-containing protein [Saprospiraceae bacterium]
MNTEETAFQNAMSIQPNPASEHAFLFYDLRKNAQLNISILNSVGQIIEQMTIENALSGNVELAIDHLSPGIYFVNITDGEYHAMKRLVVASK